MSSVRPIPIIVNGATGRMGANQHLMRSLKAIRDEGGVPDSQGDRLVPELVLVGRNPEKLRSLAEAVGDVRWSTDLDAELADRRNLVYFDAQPTDRRYDGVSRAIAAGKHVYCEKPTGTTTAEALDLYRLAVAARVNHGVVQDKLWLPGFRKLRDLIDTGFFGRILSIRGEFGYWIFSGGDPAAGGDGVRLQRPSWNYRQEDGGGMILDMFFHWRYLLEDLFGPVRSVSCHGAIHIPQRWDEQGQAYACTADDAAYATFEVGNGIIAQFNAGWSVRVRRDDLLTVQVDGTHGSAVVGLRECRVQSAAATPRAVWNPDVPNPIDFWAGWTEVPDREAYGNPFKTQWERFLLHVAEESPFPWDFRAGAQGVQLAELSLESWRRRAWVDVPDLPKIAAR